MMFETILTQILANNFILKYLPILILIHIVIGTISAIKQRKFKFEELVNYTKNGTLFILFLLLVDFLYYGLNQTDVGYMIISTFETLRGASWLAIVIYYITKIYKNLVGLGMPKLPKLESELQEHQDNEEENVIQVVDELADQTVEDNVINKEEGEG